MNLTGYLSTAKSLNGLLSAESAMNGALSVPRSISMTDYNGLSNKPQIESVTLIGNKTFEDLGLEELSGDDLISILTD